MSERPGHSERTFWFYNLDVVLLFFLDSAALLLHVRIASVYIYFDFFFFCLIRLLHVLHCATLLYGRSKSIMFCFFGCFILKLMSVFFNSFQ